MTRKTKVIAHRGASVSHHENTMAAFRQAVSDGADAIEFDLHLTADRQWVVHHDADVDTPSGQKRIAQVTAEDVRQLTTGPNRDPIPTLADFLGWVRTRPVLPLLDIKDTEGIGELIETIDQAELPIPPVFSSFRRSVLVTIGQERPQWKTGVIVGDPHMRAARRLFLPWILRWSKAHHVHALHLHDRWITRETVDTIKSAGQHVAVWTVDDPERMAELGAFGVDAIITNRPDLARHELDRTAVSDEPVAMT